MVAAVWGRDDTKPLGLALPSWNWHRAPKIDINRYCDLTFSHATFSQGLRPAATALLLESMLDKCTILLHGAQPLMGYGLPLAGELDRIRGYLDWIDLPTASTAYRMSSETGLVLGFTATP